MKWGDVLYLSVAVLVYGTIGLAFYMAIRGH